MKVEDSVRLHQLGLYHHAKWKITDVKSVTQASGASLISCPPLFKGKLKEIASALISIFLRYQLYLIQ
uniref:Uncharacterized protein n=1 Tax=Amphimedon queenslandica TaxID=400682 RepID=A0A1X7TX39_AMPQE